MGSKNTRLPGAYTEGCCPAKGRGRNVFMSTFTQNYQLHQWVPEDNFLRTDFNEDFAKIDKAIKEALTAAGSAQSAANTAQSAASTAQSAANTAQSTANSKIALVSGSYTGDGTASRTINLGFQPKAVILERRNGARVSNATYGGLALINYPCYNQPTDGGLVLTSKGFTVASKNYTSLNNESIVYYYLALR